MKLLHVIPTLNPSNGGPAEGLRQIIPHLRDLGVNSTVATIDSPNSPWLQLLPFTTVGLGPANSKYGFIPGLPNRIRSLASQHDFVIIHGIWQYHSFSTWRALRGTGIPYAVYPHGMLDPWFRQTYPLKHLKKWLYWPWADYRVLRDAEAVLFTTEQEMKLASRSFALYRANPYMVGYGTSGPIGDAQSQRDLFLSRYPGLRGKRLLLFLSRIHPKKGLDLLIEAFSAVSAYEPSLHLVIAGPDEVGLTTSLQQRATTLSIADRITWPGMLNGDLKWGAFHCAELFCLPSHQENFGIVVAESLAIGLPVCIADPVNIARDVEAAGAGIVHPDTVSGTTAALRQWVAMSPDAKAKMGERGRVLFTNSFDFASVAKNLLPILYGEKV